MLKAVFKSKSNLSENHFGLTLHEANSKAKEFPNTQKEQTKWDRKDMNKSWAS